MGVIYYHVERLILMEIPHLLIRLFIAFVVLFVLARIMGRKEISQMTFFNFVSAIAIGSIAASLAISSGLSIRNGVIALIAWAAFTISMEFIDIKFKRARKITTGEPIIVIKEGRIMEHALRKTRLDVDSLNALLRHKGVFSLKDVDYAIFETSGNLSVKEKQKNQTATKNDVNLSPNPTLYPTSTEIISDGILNTNNLLKLNLDENWVQQQLNLAGVKSLSEIFYAEVQKDGSLYIDYKDDHMQH